ncbi:HWE histidine kinase domain-containing protein [Poseidonocella sp. HB161398]|uniref:HWE histidine kinase domain-containing protein n=1 Tax=Poseidonocella sp. HB161398 TaxID=2320855 RepID=UPI001108E399|nr:HWE histidine kinase domain-containing protein [Poseidonocella sp. HB161398]
MSSNSFPPGVPADHEDRLKDPDRLTALERSALLDTLPEEAFDRAVRLATSVIGAPVGLLSLVDSERQFFKAQTGLPEAVACNRGTPLSQSFCQYVVTSGRPLSVSDARIHPLLSKNGAVSGLGVVAYMGVPIRGPDGQVLGSFCGIDSQPRQWGARELAVLEDLGAIIESEIRLRQEISTRQLLVGELNHRVKNLFSVVSGMIGMTARGAESPAEMSEALRGRINALARAHDLIRPVVTQQSEGRADVSLQALVVTLLEPHLMRQDDHVTVTGPTLSLGAGGATNLALVLHEFATNAAKYGALSVPEGHLAVTWTTEGGRLLLDWTETGGPAVEVPAAAGFGSRLVDMTVRGHFRGSMETDWRPDGLHRQLVLPLGRVEI